MEKEEWKPLNLFLVEYPSGDRFGHFLAFISISIFAVIAGFFTLFIFKRDLHTIFFGIGVALSDAINSYLKDVLREERPIVRRNCTISPDFGMPSAHTQFAAFFSVYSFYFVTYRWKIRNIFWKGITCAGLIIWILLMAVSRVYLRYHTISQVIFGIALGFFLASGWFLFVHHTATRVFPFIASLKISKFLMIRDTSSIENILEFEYKNIQNAGQNSKKKNS